MEANDDASFILANVVANIKYEDIPGEVVENTKKSILDSLGCILAASTLSDTSKKIVDLVKEAGGREESTILAFGGKVPCWMAAFANGAMGHLLDYDDTHYKTMLHPTMATLPSALATSERLGGVSGKELITAVTVANELICRMGLAISGGTGGEKFGIWNIRQIFGYFGSAAASAKILGLDEAHIASALGNVSQMSAGTVQVSIGGGCTFRGIYPAPAGFAGVLSTVMAQKGIIGPRDSLEGKAGFYKAYFDGLYNRRAIIANIGRSFETMDVGFKMWPCAGFLQSYIDATLSLVRQHSIKPEEIVNITVVVNDTTRRLFEPSEVRYKPSNSLDAKWSIPWAVACATSRGNVSLYDFSAEGIKDPIALEVARKVSPKHDPALNIIKGLTPGIVEINTRNKVYQTRVDYPYGHPRNPANRDDLIKKFIDCASYSVKPIKKENISAAVDMISKLEELEDTRRIAELLG